MSYNPDIHHRHSIRLAVYDYSQAGLYFVTICVQDKECLFGEITNGEMILDEYGKMVNDGWLEIPQHYQNVVLHEFVVMPNHIHGILEITTAVGVEYFRPKNDFRLQNDDICPQNDIRSENNKVDYLGVENIRPLRRPNCESGTIGAIVRGFKIGVTKQIGCSVWQRNYYEHIIRDCNDHARIVDYINNNPLNWEKDKFYN